MGDSETTQINATTNAVPFFKKRAKKNFRKRGSDALNTRKPADSDDDDDDDGEAVASEVVTKERKTASTPFVQSTRRRRRHQGQDDDDEEGEEESAIGVRYAADRSAKVQKEDATRYSTEWELEAAELRKRKNDSKPGAAGQKNSKMSVGPQRAPANLRVTARFDYQPDVCKDYKGIYSYTSINAKQR